MTDPMLVRRLALDLRNLADKTLELRGAVEDYRHDLVRTLEDDWCDPKEPRSCTARSRSCGSPWTAPRPSCAAAPAGCRRCSGSSDLLPPLEGEDSWASLM